MIYFYQVAEPTDTLSLKVLLIITMELVKLRISEAYRVADSMQPDI